MSIPAFDLQTLGQFFVGDNDRLDVNTAYNEVGWFRRNVDIRRNGAANMPFDLTKGDTEIVNEQTVGDDDMPLGIDVFDLIPAWFTDLDLYGAAYGILLTDEFATSGEGWVRIHPSRVTPIYNATGTLINWQIRTGNTPQTIPVERLLYIWEPNQTGGREHGRPIAEAALIAAGIINYAGIFQSGFFEKGALNPTIISIEGLKKQTPTDQTDTRSRFKNMFGGLKKASEVQVVDGKTSITTLQQPLKDMALAELSKEQKETINATLGVPFSLTMSNAANYATATQDDFNFYDKAISPQMKQVVAKQLNKKLFKPLGYSLTYQPMRLEAYRAVELQKSGTLNGMLDRGVININEYRESMQLPIEEEGAKIEETKLPEIFGYHIDAGIPTRDEVRERLGLEPLHDPGGDALSELQSKLKVVQEATNTGLSTEEAFKLVGLAVNSEKAVLDDINSELKKWGSKAVKRYIEKKPEKALEFTSDIIPEVLSDKIKAALATVETVDSVKTIFEDARLYNGN